MQRTRKGREPECTGLFPPFVDGVLLADYLFPLGKQDITFDSYSQGIDEKRGKVSIDLGLRHPHWFIFDSDCSNVNLTEGAHDWRANYPEKKLRLTTRKQSKKSMSHKATQTLE